MISATDGEFLPIELVFNPNWWNQTAGISFDRSFYLDAKTRMRNDVLMRRVLHDRYGDLELGECDPKPRPIVGSLHVAGGFAIPALLGSNIAFAPDTAPQPEPMDLQAADLDALEKPDFTETWPMKQLIADMDAMEAEYGYLVGDLNTDGLLNAVYHLYGQQMFADLVEAPGRVRRVLEIVAELIVDVAQYVRQRTGTCSISVNRMVEHVDPRLFLHANCSVPMISPECYREIHLPLERHMAERIQPFGVHHCGENLHLYAPAYAELPASFFGIGWGSDVSRCREALPDAFFNLRLSPVRMLQRTPHEIAQDTERLLLAAGPLEKAGVCCINMDYGTPDDNLFAMYEVVQRYRAYGA